jgi:hypothetical protein
MPHAGLIRLPPVPPPPPTDPELPAVSQRAFWCRAAAPMYRSTTHPRAAHKAADQWARWGAGPLNRPTRLGSKYAPRFVSPTTDLRWANATCSEVALTRPHA